MGAGRHYSATQPQPRLAIRCGRSNHHTSRPRSYSCVRVAQDLLLPLASVHRVTAEGTDRMFWREGRPGSQAFDAGDRHGIRALHHGQGI